MGGLGPRRGHAGNTEQEKAKLSFLRPVRERVLDNAKLRADDVVLDVGAGEGLIAFGALDRLGPQGQVIFNDISQALLDHSRLLSRRLGVEDRSEFLNASADELEPLKDDSVDVLTTRSVLIYLPAARKEQAFREFFRVLKPGGRFSLFEPINSFGHPEPPGVFWGFDVAPVKDLAEKIKHVYRGEDDSDASLGDFDERDLLSYAENAGFSEIHLHYEAEVSKGTWFTSWDAFLDTAGNPLIATQREAIERALTPEEATRFIAHLRPLLERRDASNRSACAYLFGANGMG